VQGTKAEDPHYHEVPLPDGTIVPTGPPIGEPATAAAAAPDSYSYSTPQDGKREYVRDDHGRFSSEGAGGAANDALDARGVALAVAGTKNPQEAAAGRQRLAGLVDRATARARSTLGREHPATRTLSAISSRARTADARGLQTLAGELGRVNERLAEEAAAGKSAPGTKEDRRVEPTDTDPDAEKAAAAGAYATQDPASLPAYGREIYDRMHDTTFQMFGKADDPASERYASGVAWRAVAQAYGFASAPSGPAKAATLPQAAGQRPPVSGHGRFVSTPHQAKGIPWGGPVFSEGGFWIVPVSRSRGAENLYDRIDSRVIPDSGGAVVRVGIGRPNNHKQIIDVRVPKRMVDSTPGGSGAAGWVQWNMDIIRAIAQSDVSPGALIRQSVVKALAEPAPAARLDVTGCKFVTSPEKAQERITYDVVYAPWEVDLQGQYATEDEVRKMAHEFIARKGGMNLMHITGLKMTDGRPAGEPVESFIARAGDPDFPRGAWVMGVKWHPEAWEQVKSGRLTGYSIEGQWGVVPLHLVPSKAEMGIG